MKHSRKAGAGEILPSLETRTRSRSETRTPSVSVVFPFRDRQGRQLGATAHFGTETFTDLTQEEASARFVSWSRIAAGEWFWFSPSSTRNGKRYGACQSRRYFETVAAAELAARDYLSKAAKRASKVRGAQPAVIS